MNIDKSFWESKHSDSDRYWLTGSSLRDIMHLHNLTIDDIKNKKMLEIGVGFGNLSIDAVNHVKELICCDISEVALTKVHPLVTKKYLTTELSKIEPVDLAVCHLVFQHCIDSEIERIINDVVLSDDGIFSFQFAFLRENEEPNENVKNLINGGSHHFRSIETITDMVNKANKEIISISEPMNYYNPENFSWLMIKIKNKK
jgi:hypothetical protein